MTMRTIAWLAAGLVLFGAADQAHAGKKDKKKKGGEVEVSGWHQEEGWQGACYFPKNYEKLGAGDRKLARSEALREMLSQWNGSKGDGVSFDETATTNAETALLGKPDWIERMSQENLEECKKWAKSGDSGSWASWLNHVHGTVNEGDCKNAPLDYSLFDYLDIGKGWQIPAGVCKGDTFKVIGTTIDYYKVRPDGPWINVVGDTSVAALGDKYPCNVEGCVEGMLIMRFTDEQGIETILPVGEELDWTAPNHGKIEVRINDDSFFDNVYKQEGSMIHHTGVTYQGGDA